MLIIKFTKFHLYVLPKRVSFIVKSNTGNPILVILISRGVTGDSTPRKKVNKNDTTKNITTFLQSGFKNCLKFIFYFTFLKHFLQK